MAAIQPKPTSFRLTSLLVKLPRLEFYNSSLSIPLLTFKPFPRPPRELRNIICGMITSEPRVVKVIDAVAVQIWKSAVEGQSRQPAVMHVNQELRSEGARFYTLCREKTRREVCRNEQLRTLYTLTSRWTRFFWSRLIAHGFIGVEATLIWKRAALEPRLIKIFEIDNALAKNDSVIKGQVTNPGIMGACSESRKEGKKVYELRSPRVPDPITGKPVLVYINFNIDTFVLELPLLPLAPRALRPLQIGVLLVSHIYNYRVMDIKRIERLSQVFTASDALMIPLKLLDLGNIKQVTVSIDYWFMTDREERGDTIDKLVRRTVVEAFKQMAERRLTEQCKEASALKGWEVELVWNDDLLNCELDPGLPIGREVDRLLAKLY
ncbi:hypothetical protein ACEPPN_006449 [Leptodophora sp. 'Broadleaf-Isolate-01']